MGTELKKTYEHNSVAPPFPYMPKEEWQSRIDKARRLMSEKGIDALIILNCENRLYFFGSRKTYRFVYPSVGIIPLNAPTTLVTTAEDRDVLDMQGYAERAIGYRGDFNAPNPVAPDPIKLVAEVVEDLGLADKTIGMEFGPFMWWDGMTMNEWGMLKESLPHAKFVDATELIWEMRMIKSEWEVDVMKYLYKATAKGFLEIAHNAAPGKNERDLFYDAMRVWMDMGIVDSAYYYLQVVNAVQPFRDRVLKQGDWMLLDGGPQYKGYNADIQRMIHIGEPGKEGRRMASWAYKAQLAVQDMLRPGVAIGDLWHEAFAVVAQGDPDIWRKARSRKFPSWIGHGEGLGMHEMPYLVEGSDVVLRKGMVLAIEIPSFFERRLANMPEDAYLITEDGYEILTADFGPGDIYVKT